MSEFSDRLIRWQRRHGRHGLPWQTDDPYRIWLSEIMLQQTQVATVSAYYPKFIQAFPRVQDLAAAEQDQVLQLWAGLGYYSRARNLHQAAQQIVNEFGGRFPSDRQQLQSLKGVGRSTAAAIAAFAFKQPETILDGNVKRVLCRVFALAGDPADKAFERTLWDLAESLLPQQRDDMPAYTQGLMDLGATVCRRSRPLCDICPMADICLAKRDNRQAELPQRKTAAAVKQQTLYWLDMRRADGAVLLHKRPPRGIWAGLYCLPCFDSLADLQQFAAAYGLEADELHEQPAIAHRLTHRQLEILPFAAAHLDTAQTARSQALMNGQPENVGQLLPQAVWVPLSGLTDYGLPKPLTRYFQAAV